jgi:hypothetical protein
MGGVGKAESPETGDYEEERVLMSRKLKAESRKLFCKGVVCFKKAESEKGKAFIKGLFAFSFGLFAFSFLTILVILQ